MVLKVEDLAKASLGSIATKDRGHFLLMFLFFIFNKGIEERVGQYPAMIWRPKDSFNADHSQWSPRVRVSPFLTKSSNFSITI